MVERHKDHPLHALSWDRLTCIFTLEPCSVTSSFLHPPVPPHTHILSSWGRVISPLVCSLGSAASSLSFCEGSELCHVLLPQKVLQQTHVLTFSPSPAHQPFPFHCKQAHLLPTMMRAKTHLDQPRAVQCAKSISPNYPISQRTGKFAHPQAILSR